MREASEERGDDRADQNPVTNLDELLSKHERPTVKVAEFAKPHDRDSTWKSTKQATVARKKKATRALKPPIRKRLTSILKGKDDEGLGLYILGGIGAAIGLVFLLKK